MQRRWLVLVGLAVLIAGAAIFGTRASGVADEQKTIGVIVAGKMSARTGNECIILRKEEPPAGFTMPHQVIIEDASGTIVAKRDLSSFPLEGQTPTDKVEMCTATLSIDVPNSPFYRVYADDQLVTVVDANDLPLDTASTSPPVAPWIDFGE